MSSKGKLTSLEIVRGIAAFTVVINHLIGKTPYFQEHRNFVTGLIGAWGTEAVLVFFVLSGIVIGISQDRNPKSKKQFILNRIIRIWPIMLLSIAITLVVDKSLYNHLAPIKTILGNIFFLGTLQGYIVPVLENNPVLWSLSFEMFFYLIFTFCIGNKEKNRLLIWLFVAFISSIIYAFNFHSNYKIINHLIAIFAYSILWLGGYYTYRYRSLFKINKITALLFLSSLPLVSRINISTNYYDIIKHCLFTITIIPFFLYLVNEKISNQKEIKLSHFWLWYFFISLGLIFISDSLLLNKILYLSLPIITILTIRILKIIPINNSIIIKPIIINFMVFLGSISYAIYCIHFPLLIIYNHYCYNMAIYIPLYFSTITIISFVIESLLQPKLTRTLKKIK